MQELLKEPGIDPLNERIGREIRRIREQVFRMSQTGAARHVFGALELQSQWSRWELGKVRPNVKTLEAIARKAGVSLSVFGLRDAGPDALDPGEMAALRYHLAKALAVASGLNELPEDDDERRRYVLRVLRGEG